MQHISSMKNTKSTLRNLIIFSLVVISSGWLGYALDTAMNNPPGQSLGMLLWLVLPLVALIVLRTFAGDGWRDFGLRPNFKGNAAWYALSALAYPLSAILVLGLGLALGLITLRSELVSAWAITAVGAILPSFIKNIFEEFAWRGHLAPKISALGLKDYVGHLLVGVIWWAWHIPYWLFYIDRSLIQVYAPSDLPLFFFMALINLMAASVVYGEIRLLTNSVWPAVLMHTAGNALVDTLTIAQLAVVVPGFTWLISPNPISVVMFLIFLALGVALRTYRLRGTNMT